MLTMLGTVVIVGSTLILTLLCSVLILPHSTTAAERSRFAADLPLLQQVSAACDSHLWPRSQRCSPRRG